MNRYESTKKVGLFGILGNLFLLIMKLSVSLISQSQAMFADAINSAGDIFSSFMTFIGNKMASIPKDEDHNFGHGKAEYIYSLLISIFMILVAIKILFDSLFSIIKHKTFTFSYFLIIVCILTILIKFILYIYSKKMYQKHKNILVKATMKDHRNDMVLTSSTLLAIILGKFGYYYFDGIFGSLTSLYILFSGVSIFLESYKILMDISLDKKEKEEIINYILNHEEVFKIDEFNTLAVGYKYIAILTIHVDGNLSTFTSHEIADKIELEIPKKFKKICKVIVHVNPVEVVKKK